eukprot:scaffold5121_cov223-Ochromonas_danica.AAC.1
MMVDVWAVLLVERTVDNWAQKSAEKKGMLSVKPMVAWKVEKKVEKKGSHWVYSRVERKDSQMVHSTVARMVDSLAGWKVEKKALGLVVQRDGPWVAFKSIFADWKVAKNSVGVSRFLTLRHATASQVQQLNGMNFSTATRTKAGNQCSPVKQTFP